MHLQVSIGVVAGRGQQQFAAVRHDERPLGLAGGVPVLGVDPVGLLGEVGGDGIQGRRHGRAGDAQLGEFRDVRGDVLLAASGVPGVEDLDDVDLAHRSVGQFEGQQGHMGTPRDRVRRAGPR